MHDVDRSDATRAAQGGTLAARVLASWSEHDIEGALHAVDRSAIRNAEAGRALVVELFSSGPERDLYNACAALGRLLAEAGASPSLAVSTIDAAARAFAEHGVRFDDSRLAAARASTAEGYVAAERGAEHEKAKAAWEYPACVVRLDDETAAVAAGYPAADGEGVAEWAARTASKLSRAGIRVAVVSGPDATRSELVCALSLVGIATTDRLGPRARQRKASPGWLRLPWRK